MENPCLTFVTPTIISGDRTLATVVQHEITHSWTGNLVSYELILYLIIRSNQHSNNMNNDLV